MMSLELLLVNCTACTDISLFRYLTCAYTFLLIYVLFSSKFSVTVNNNMPKTSSWHMQLYLVNKLNSDSDMKR